MRRSRSFSTYLSLRRMTDEQRPDSLGCYHVTASGAPHEPRQSRDNVAHTRERDARGEERPLLFEHGGNAAFLKGSWKLVRAGDIVALLAAITSGTAIPNYHEGNYLRRLA